MTQKIMLQALIAATCIFTPTISASESYQANGDTYVLGRCLELNQHITNIERTIVEFEGTSGPNRDIYPLTQYDLGTTYLRLADRMRSMTGTLDYLSIAGGEMIQLRIGSSLGEDINPLLLGINEVIDTCLSATPCSESEILEQTSFLRHLIYEECKADFAG